jgi:imidazolonepropionase-like amidohydrolase
MRTFGSYLVLLAIGIWSFAGVAQTPTSASLAVTDVTVIDTATGTVTSDMTVVVSGERIVSVVKGGAVPVGAQVVEGRGKFLIPGLWDMHVHLSYARASSLPVFAAMGVTYVRDVGSDLSEIDVWRDQISGKSITGPTILRAGPILNGQKSNPYHQIIANAANARIAARTLKKAGVDVLKTHRLTSRDAYFALADEAKILGLPLIGHVPMTVSPAEASDAGQQTIEHVETLFEGTFAAAHNGLVLAADMAQWRASPEAASLFQTFVRNGTVVDPTIIAASYLARRMESATVDPRLQYLAASTREMRQRMLSSVPAVEKRAWSPLVRERQAVTGQMQRAGVTLITGTDTSFLHPPGFALHDELDMLVESGLTPAEALRAATINCAKLFPSLDVGAIAPGKLADLVLLDADPRADIHNTLRIDTVVVRGRAMNRLALDRMLAQAVQLARTQ